MPEAKERKKDYTQQNAAFQRTARRDKKAFLSEQWKNKTKQNKTKQKQRKTTERKTRDLFKKNMMAWSLIQIQTSFSVKCALGSITTNKASGGDGILAELFHILNDAAVKVIHSICQKIWKSQQ